MRYLAVDFGAKRLGLAVCDEGEILVSPLRALDRRGTRSDVARLLEEVRAQGAGGVVFGVPRALEQGEQGASEAPALAFARELRALLEREAPNVSFDEQDERFSTALALRQGRESGLSQKKGRASDGAQSIDARAAANILQSFLDARAAQKADSDLNSSCGEAAHD
jgi:putative Holliday junction resolvase